MNYKKILSFLKCTYPYLLLIAVTFIANYFVFFHGIMAGDDIRFHLFSINDLLYGFEHGYFSISTNHLFMGGFAVYNYGFYGPVPHYSAAILAFIFRNSAEFGYKAVIILSSYIGGVFFYKLAKKMSGNTHIASIASTMYILMPYRIFCAVCRCAFAEVVAICFIPLIFYGAYSIVHDMKYKVGPYLSLVIGASVTIMSHPFTGLMCAIFGVLYLAFNIKLLFKKREGFSILPSCFASLFLILFLTGFYIGNALVTKSIGIYRLNDPIIDWTNYQHVADSTALSLQFSGFLNFIYIFENSNMPGWNVENVSFIIMSLFIFLLSIVNVILSDSLIRKAPKNNYYRWVVNGVALFMFPLIFGTRIEIFFALILFFIIFNIYSYLYKVEDYENSPRIEQIKFNPDFYFLILSIFVCLLFMFAPKVWLYVPDIFYQAQFAWRLWGLTMFFIAMLLTLFVSYFQKYKGAIISFATLATILVGLSQGLIEKRISKDNGGKVFENVDYAFVTTIPDARYSGAQNEMVPLILMDDTYEPEYENSLYHKVHYAFKTWYYTNHSFIFSIEDYQKYNPVFLEGYGSITITNYNSPNNTFEVEVTTEKALVQFPQIYNVGYFGYANGVNVGEAKNVDGLIAFELSEGKYTFDLVFKNSLPYRIAKPFFYIGLASLVPLTVLGIYFEKKLSSKEEEK